MFYNKQGCLYLVGRKNLLFLALYVSNIFHYHRNGKLPIFCLAILIFGPEIKPMSTGHAQTILSCHMGLLVRGHMQALGIEAGNRQREKSV